tara:strand:+ start:276 stop:449 length:174 start_codon:yes stop_codon:yes gene_type:complete
LRVLRGLKAAQFDRGDHIGYSSSKRMYSMSKTLKQNKAKQSKGSDARAIALTVESRF